MIHIVDLELNRLAVRLKEKGFTLEVCQDAKDLLVETGTDEKFGARPLRRAIEHNVEDALSEAMLRGEFTGKKKVVVTVDTSGGEDGKPKIKIEGMEDDAAQPEAVGAGAQGT